MATLISTIWWRLINWLGLEDFPGEFDHDSVQRQADDSAGEEPSS